MPFIYSVEKRAEHFTVSGAIHFAQDPPKKFPPKSELRVFMEDISIWDSNSRRLQETVVDLSNYKTENKLEYSMSLMPKPKPSETYNIAAVLNVGWKPEGRGPDKDWIKTGDFQTSKMFVFAVSKDKNNYTKDIELERIDWHEQVYSEK